MWQCQYLAISPFITEGKQVDVDDTRTEARGIGFTPTPQTGFDIKQRSKKPLRYHILRV